jgi:HAD superfamily hydrolase (TIGR01509 family)
MNLKCIIFDLDGTLVNSEPLSYRALIELLPEINENVEVLTERYHGGKFTKIIADVKNRFQCSIPEDFEPSFRKHVSEIFEKELQPIPGAIEVLRQIDLPCCIASSGPLAKITHSLQITGLAEFFGTNLYSAYDIGSWKPEPDLFLYAARQMGVKPDECIVIEDSPTGVEASKAAGMAVLHFSSKPLESNSKTYNVFSDMTELPMLLTRFGNVA